jgi:hypothetical protein
MGDEKEYVDIEQVTFSEPKKRPAPYYDCPVESCENKLRFSAGKTVCGVCGTWVQPAAKIVVEGHTEEGATNERDDGPTTRDFNPAEPALSDAVSVAAI